MIVFALLGCGFLFAAVLAGACADRWVVLRDRRRLAQAFRPTREAVTHLPTPRPAEAWPVWISVAGDAA